MSETAISYHFAFDDGTSKEYTIRFDEKTLSMISDDIPDAHPEFADLDFHKCEHCPLSKKDSPQCPIARNLEPIAAEFNSLVSYNQVTVQVKVPERTYTKRVALQDGLYSLFGLIMATSGCPHMNFLKPMARYHLPFSSIDETLVRTTSFYLLRQYFLNQKGIEADFEFKGLDASYDAVSKVNEGIINRVRELSEADADVNSLIILDSYQQIYIDQADNGFDDLAHQFTL